MTLKMKKGVLGFLPLTLFLFAMSLSGGIVLLSGSSRVEAGENCAKFKSAKDLKKRDKCCKKIKAKGLCTPYGNGCTWSGKSCSANRCFYPGSESKCKALTPEETLAGGAVNRVCTYWKTEDWGNTHAPHGKGCYSSPCVHLASKKSKKNVCNANPYCEYITKSDKKNGCTSNKKTRHRCGCQDKLTSDWNSKYKWDSKTKTWKGVHPKCAGKKGTELKKCFSDQEYLDRMNIGDGLHK